MMISPKVSLRDLHVRHIDSDKWTKVGRFEVSECNKLKKHYRAMGFDVRIDGALVVNKIKQHMKPSKVSIVRFS